VDESVEAGEVLAPHAQEVVGLTRERPGGGDLGQGGEEAREGARGVGRMRRHLDLHEGLDREADRAGSSRAA
jgi:hypothetical protein